MWWSGRQLCSGGKRGVNYLLISTDPTISPSPPPPCPPCRIHPPTSSSYGNLMLRTPLNIEKYRALALSAIPKPAGVCEWREFQRASGNQLPGEGCAAAEPAPAHRESLSLRPLWGGLPWGALSRFPNPGGDQVRAPPGSVPVLCPFSWGQGADRCQPGHLPFVFSVVLKVGTVVSSRSRALPGDMLQTRIWGR